MEFRGQWCCCCFSKYDLIISKVNTQQITSRSYSCNSSSEMSSSDLSSGRRHRSCVCRESISDHHPSPKSVTEGAMCFTSLPHYTDTLPVCCSPVAAANSPRSLPLVKEKQLPMIQQKYERLVWTGIVGLPATATVSETENKKLQMSLHKKITKQHF